MIKKFCDVCDKEVSRLLTIAMPCHLWEFRGSPGYVDMEGNSVSGRINEVDVCQMCHNRVMDKAAVELIKIADENELIVP